MARDSDRGEAAEQQHTQAQVFADAQLLSDILAIQPALVSRFTFDGHVVWCNDAYAAHLFCTPAEVIGTTWVDHVVELGYDSREHLDGVLAGVVASTEFGTTSVVAPMYGSGPTRWIQWLNRRLPVVDGEPPLIQGIGVEVTELRAARDALDAMAHELARGRLAERRELARRLHDDAIQVLVSAMWAISPSDGCDVSAADATRGVELVKEAIEHLRGCLSDLTSPPVLPGLLADALAADVQAVRDAGVDVYVDVADAPREEIRSVAARVLSEGLRNVLRHAQATTASVTLRVEGDHVIGAVADDGIGATGDDLTRALASGHVGLLMSRALVESIDGTWSVGPSGGRGTMIEFRVPIRR
jgi:signal transduction histidine kinase